MDGLIKYESLLDGTLTIDDVSLLNDAIDVKIENELRYKDATE